VFHSISEQVFEQVEHPVAVGDDHAIASDRKRRRLGIDVHPCAVGEVLEVEPLGVTDRLSRTGQHQHLFDDRLHALVGGRDLIV